MLDNMLAEESTVPSAELNAFENETPFFIRFSIFGILHVVFSPSKFLKRNESITRINTFCFKLTYKIVLDIN